MAFDRFEANRVQLINLLTCVFAALINRCQTWVKCSSLKNASINVMALTLDYLWKALAKHAPDITPILAVVAVK